MPERSCGRNTDGLQIVGRRRPRPRRSAARSQPPRHRTAEATDFGSEKLMAGMASQPRSGRYVRITVAAA